MLCWCCGLRQPLSCAVWSGNVAGRVYMMDMIALTRLAAREVLFLSGGWALLDCYVDASMKLRARRIGGFENSLSVASEPGGAICVVDHDNGPGLFMINLLRACCG